MADLIERQAVPLEEPKFWIRDSFYDFTRYTCPYCGQSVFTEGFRFCPWCGEEVRGESNV